MVQALPTTPTRPIDDSDALYEIAYGEYREIQDRGAQQSFVGSTIAMHLDAFGREHKLGAAVSEMLFLLDSERNLQRRYPAAFVLYDRWPEPTLPNTDAWNVVPDLVVEVIGPVTLGVETDRRLAECFRAGVRQFWVIYLETGNVYVFESADRCRILHRGDVLEGGDILPGFRLPIDELLSSLTKPG